MDFFEGVILSSWSYIMGPQVEHLFIPNDSPESPLVEVPTTYLKDFNLSKKCTSSESLLFTKNIQLNLQKFLMMSGQLLLSEVETSKPFQENTSRFFLTDDKILSAVVFNLNLSPNTSKDKENICVCLGVLFKCEVLHFILDSIQLIDLHLRRAIDILQKAKKPIDDSMKEISVILGDLKKLLYSLHSSSVAHLSAEIKFQNTLNSKLMSKAIVSHLQTSGHSVVIGGSQFVINQVLQLLSMFNGGKEKCCSLGLSSTSDKSFYHGLYIQASLKTENNQNKSLLEEALLSLVPLTVIDTDWGKVRQSLALDNSEKNRNSWQNVTETGTLVPQLLEDLVFFKNDQEHNTLIKQFHRFVTIKSVSLIKIIENFRKMGKLLIKNELMTMLGISDLADLQIIMGCAEKLKPGIRTSIL